MFDIRGYRHTKKNEQGITFYNGYVEDEFVRITVHVTDHLTGNHSLSYNLRNVKVLFQWLFKKWIKWFNKFKCHY